MAARPAWTDAALREISEMGVAVHVDPPSRRSAAEDFGHLARGNPAGVALPQSPEACERLVAFASARGLPLTVRGRGHSHCGQSLALEGNLTLDCSRMDGVGPLDASLARIRCQAGARLREVVRATAPRGLLPTVVPLNLDMSVGGLLSAGGIGANAHRFGPVVANVDALDVVTGTGERYLCSQERHPDLFHAVLAGQGQVAVILEATLQLRRVASYVRTFQLLYSDLAPMLTDAGLLTRAERADYLEGFCWATAKGVRMCPDGARPFAHWMYGLTVGLEYAGQPPQAEETLAGLSPFRVVDVQDMDTERFTFRYQPRFDAMYASGNWERPHPWLESFILQEKLSEILPELLDLLPMSMGDGHRLIWVRGTDRAPLLKTSPEMAICFAVLPVGVAPFELAGALEALEKVHQRLVKAGGWRYQSGWPRGLSDEDRRTHLGESHDAWARAKATHDPRSVLGRFTEPVNLNEALLSSNY